MPRFEYLFRETTSGLRRNGLVAFAAISTTFIALFLFGLSLLISRQVSLMIEATTGNVEVAVYLTDPVNPDTVSSLSQTLTELPVRDNYFLHQILTGHYPAAGLPPYLSEPVKLDG